MSRAEDYLQAVHAQAHADLPKPVFELLHAIGEAWTDAEGGITPAESRRWSPVCTLAEALVIPE